MAFKMKGYNTFTQKTNQTKNKYPKGKSRVLKNIGYKITGNTKYLKK